MSTVQNQSKEYQEFHAGLLLPDGQRYLIIFKNEELSDSINIVGDCDERKIYIGSPACTDDLAEILKEITENKGGKKMTVRVFDPYGTRIQVGSIVATNSTVGTDDGGEVTYVDKKVVYFRDVNGEETDCSPSEVYVVAHPRF